MEFKFSIGQFVTTLESKAGYDLFESQRTDGERRALIALGKQTVPIILIILERSFQECFGGTQVHYLCRYHDAAGYTEHWFNEIELVEHPNLKQ